MKSDRSTVRSKARKSPEVKFESQSLTSFAGLVIFNDLFRAIGFRELVGGCFRHLQKDKVYGHITVFMQLVIHLLLGFRELCHVRFYKDDPLVRRLVGTKQLACAATISRNLRSADETAVEKLRLALRGGVIEALADVDIQRLTLEFDGSVQSTRRKAEGTAVGFNKKRKGQRSYYPLFCTIAQTGQVFDFLHRSGNVHDSNGAEQFIMACVEAVRAAYPGVIIEARMDSAFFSDAIVRRLHQAGVEFTITVPFERFVGLKEMIESRYVWYRINEELAYFETLWKPVSWHNRFRFVFVRQLKEKIQKGPIQLDLFEPIDREFEYKVVVTNREVGADAVTRFHDGRGSQEGILGEVKSACHGGHVPVRTRVGNQLYLLAGLFAHNLTRQLQMRCEARERTTTPQRAALWTFERLDTLRKAILQRAGRLTSPQGKLTLTMSASGVARRTLLRYLGPLRNAA